jgi:hypothetical protein
MSNDKWAIMAYFAGNNNLEEEMVFAIKELCRVGTPADLDIFLQFDCGGPPIRFGSDLFDENTETPEIREDWDLLLKGTILGGYDPNVPTSRILEDFMCHCIEESDADRYMLILSGHGSGAVGDFLSGDDPASGLTINGLERTLKNVANRVKPERAGPGKERKLLDILGMDSCLMGMAETVYAVRESVECMVAAEGFELNTGWPYARFLNKIKETEGTADYALNFPSDKLAGTIAKHYCKYYDNYTLADVSTDMAALKLSGIEELGIAINALSRKMEQELQNQRSRDAILLAHWEAQTYKDEQYVDIWDFCDRLRVRSDELKRECNDVIEAIEDVVLFSCWTGAAFQHSHGISVFFPWAEMEDALGTSEFELYGDLDWSYNSHWDNFLWEYVRRTRILPRSCDSLEELEADQAIEDPKERIYRTSRLNRRYGIFREGEESHRWRPPRNRWRPPRNRWRPPWNKGGSGESGKMGNMENRPIHYRVNQPEE